MLERSFASACGNRHPTIGANDFGTTPLDGHVDFGGEYGSPMATWNRVELPGLPIRTVRTRDRIAFLAYPGRAGKVRRQHVATPD